MNVPPVEIMDPNNIGFNELFYSLNRIEFLAAVSAFVLCMVFGVLIWFLVVLAKNEKSIW